MEDLRGKQFVTDQYVKAAHGKAVRDWPFIACSDRPFTEVLSMACHSASVVLTPI